MPKKKDKHQYIIVWEDEVTEEPIFVKFDTLKEAVERLEYYKKDNPEIKHTIYAKLT